MYSCTHTRTHHCRPELHAPVLYNCSNIANTAQFFHLNSIAFIMKTGEHHVHIDAILYSDYKVTATGYDECRINNPKLFLHISLGTAEKIIPMYTLQSGSMFIFC